MLNLIKLMVAMALTFFSVNASAYVMTNQESWDRTLLPTLVRERTAYDQKAVKEHVMEHRKHLREHRKDVRKYRNLLATVSKENIKVEKKIAKVIMRTADKEKIVCGWLCADDNDFGLGWAKGKGYMGQDKDGMDELEQLHTDMDKYNGYDPKDPRRLDYKPDYDVPEPGMVGLLALGLLGMAVRRRLKA